MQSRDYRLRASKICSLTGSGQRLCGASSGLDPALADAARDEQDLLAQGVEQRSTNAAVEDRVELAADEDLFRPVTDVAIQDWTTLGGERLRPGSDGRLEQLIDVLAVVEAAPDDALWYRQEWPGLSSGFESSGLSVAQPVSANADGDSLHHGERVHVQRQCHLRYALRCEVLLRCCGICLHPRRPVRLPINGYTYIRC